jgi:hypothetical protein
MLISAKAIEAAAAIAGKDRDMAAHHYDIAWTWRRHARPNAQHASNHARAARAVTRPGQNHIGEIGAPSPMRARDIAMAEPASCFREYRARI